MSGVGNTLNNRYQLEKKVGEGGFATVYLSTDLELGRMVAVKVLSDSWATDQEFLRRFRNEARAIAALDHPNILLIHDFGVAQGTAYLVMPYVSGGTFSGRMKQSRLTLDEIAFYLEQISTALDYAHQKGIVHRDIKPTNMLLRGDGRLVLTDFGLAKLLDNASVEAPTGVLGTVAYMAPEQFQGLVSGASDIYALGIMLYQMILGKLPYEGNTREVLLGHIQRTPPPLTGHPNMQQIDPRVTQALDQVMAKVLAKRPSDRYPNCQALTAAFRGAIQAGKNTPANQQAYQDPEDTIQPDPKEILKTPRERQNLSPVAPPRGIEPAGYPPPLRPPPIPQQPPPNFGPPGPHQGPGQPPFYGEATEIAPPPRPVPRRQVMLKPPTISVSTEPDQGYRATFDLTGETITLGRTGANNISIPIPIVSSNHAFLYRLNTGPQAPHYRIVDRGSVNHLYFKGQEMPEKVLEDGDQLEIGVRGYGPYIVKLQYHAPVFGFE